MVLFLFVIMMLDLGHPEKAARPGSRDWWPALFLGAVTGGASLAIGLSRTVTLSGGSAVGIREFALVLFRNYGIAVEIISMQLLFALVGALYLGKRMPSPPASLPGGEAGQRPGED
jgi:NADH-quinone oxidoreductase subunit J